MCGPTSLSHRLNMFYSCSGGWKYGPKNIIFKAASQNEVQLLSVDGKPVTVMKKRGYGFRHVMGCIALPLIRFGLNYEF